MHVFRGYTAPEYAIHGQLSEKVDIYSYGVVILEIISGQRSKASKDDGDTEDDFLLPKVRKIPYYYYFKLHYFEKFYISRTF